MQTLRQPVPTQTPAPPPAPAKHRRRRLARKTLIIGGVTAILVFIVPVIAFVTLSGKSNGKISAVRLVVSAAKAAIEPTVPLQGESDGRTNMIVLGMTEDGMRTDSILLTSYYWQQKKLVTLNIPRDLYVYDGYENCKMGEVYAYARLRQPKNPTYPATFLAQLLSKEYHVDIPYWVKFNMLGEVQLVNTLGGVDVNVPDSFTDYEYPTWDYSGYVRPAPSFSAGLQHMDGTVALEYSRSRHSLDNDEGSDFARSRRQQIVLAAVMTKVKALGIVGNLADITKYLGILGRNVTTNLSSDEMVSMAKVFRGVDPKTDYLAANWATGNGFLCDSTSSYGAYIILYGVAGDCNAEAGTADQSVYRDDAATYVENLYEKASGAPAAPTPSPSPLASPSPGN